MPKVKLKFFFFIYQLFNVCKIYILCILYFCYIGLIHPKVLNTLSIIYKSRLTRNPSNCIKINLKILITCW